MADNIVLGWSLDREARRALLDTLTYVMERKA